MDRTAHPQAIPAPCIDGGRPAQTDGYFSGALYNLGSVIFAFIIFLYSFAPVNKNYASHPHT
jgi:hypothetical protein